MQKIKLEDHVDGYNLNNGENKIKYLVMYNRNYNRAYLPILISINYKDKASILPISSFEYMAENLISAFKDRIKVPIELKFEDEFPNEILNKRQRYILEEIVKMQNVITKICNILDNN